MLKVNNIYIDAHICEFLNALRERFGDIKIENKNGNIKSYCLTLNADVYIGKRKIEIEYIDSCPMSIEKFINKHLTEKK